MKEFRITKARTVEVIRQYRGKPDGIQAELTKGGIDISKPYTQTRDKDTGDYIYLQADAWVEPVVEPEPKKTVKPSKKKIPALISGLVGKKGKKGK